MNYTQAGNYANCLFPKEKYNKHPKFVRWSPTLKMYVVCQEFKEYELFFKFWEIFLIL